MIIRGALEQANTDILSTIPVGISEHVKIPITIDGLIENGDINH